MDHMVVLAGISLLAVAGLRGLSAKKQKRESEPSRDRQINEDASAFGGTDLGDFGLSEGDVIRQLYKTEESPKPEPIVLILETPEAHGARILGRILEEDYHTRTVERPAPPIIVVDDMPYMNRRPPRLVRRGTITTRTGNVTLKNGEILPCTVIRQCGNGSLIVDTPRGTMRKKKRYVRTGA